MRKITTLSKPMPSAKAEAALAFAEANTPAIAKKADTVEKRVFFAPEGYRRLTVNLPIELHKKLKLAAIEQDCTATEIIERLLEKALSS